MELDPSCEVEENKIQMSGTTIHEIVLGHSTCSAF